MAAFVEQKATAAARSAPPVPLRVALVGCGAVSERLHLPALSGSAAVRVSVLVDPDAQRLASLAARAGPDVRAAPSLVDIERFADAAIVAVPNHLHTPIAVELLERGLHVLVEKPPAVSLEEARALVTTAKRSGRALSIGLLRRHYPSFAFARQALDAGWLGRIRSFDLREGVINTWPATTLSFFQREHGGGVLLDAGAHALDWLLALLGPFARVDYRDDAQGGVEANCLLELELRSGARGVIELSRTRELRNTCVLRGDRGELEIGLNPDSAVILRTRTSQVSGYASDDRASGGDVAGAARRQLEAFVDCIVTGRESPVPAGEALEPARLFDACRSARRALTLPWEPFDGEIDWPAFAGKRVLVLGGAGFIGSRVVQALAQKSGARLRVLARSYTGVGNIARYPVEIVRGDVGDRAALDRALDRCDFVINCTYGKGDRREQQRVNVDAVRALIELAAPHHVRQVVHVSTIMVYGVPPDGVLDEQVRTRPARRDHYGYTKRQGEEVALSTGSRLGVGVAVVQPAAVYGPGAPSWTLRPLREMKAERAVLVDGGAGISNAVYVDDVVAALLRAAVEPRAAGERLLVAAPDVVTWREFFGAYDELLGGGRVVAMDAAEIAAARRQQRKQQGNLAQLRALIREEQRARQRLLAVPALAAARRTVEAVLPRHLTAGVRDKLRATTPETVRVSAPADPVRLPNRTEERFYRAAVRIDCTRATDLIGYRPRYRFAGGMERVVAWARWARLV